MSTLYDNDVCEWSKTQSKLILDKRWDELDIDNIAEEIESLGKSYRRALRSQISRLLMHMLKLRYQPNMQTDSNSWQRSITQARRDIARLVNESPSLRREVEGGIKDEYDSAREDAAFETCLDEKVLPKECPWTVSEILEDLSEQ